MNSIKAPYAGAFFILTILKSAFIFKPWTHFHKNEAKYDGNDDSFNKVKR